MKHNISKDVNKNVKGGSSTGKNNVKNEMAGKSLSDQAYAAILEAMFAQKIPAGAVVSQGELVDMLGIPVQPLRDALRVLQAEGVVTIHARSGVEFLQPDLELARSTYQFRSVIECAGVRAFAESGDMSFINSLIEAHEECIVKMRSEGISEETLGILDDLETEFHGAIINALRNPLIERVAKRLKNYMSLIKLEKHYTVPVAVRTLSEHLEVLRGCAEMNADKAEEALVMHFRMALNRTIGMI